jgi:hypothetical protein
MNPGTLSAFGAWTLRIALSATFLSAVADRFGFWGAAGSPGVAWGDWEHFCSYSDKLNAWAPSGLQMLLAYGATALEIVLGIALCALPKQAWVAGIAAALLCVFAISMTFAIGPKAALDYSVWVSAAAAALLATTQLQRR